MFIQTQKKRHLAHIIRSPDDAITKRIMFNDEASLRPGNLKTFRKTVIDREDCTEEEFHELALAKKY